MAAQDVDERRRLALTALLSSIASKSAESTGNPDAISPEKMQELANQLSDILLDGTDGEANISRDDEVSNENGEPVVEIIEPVSPASSPRSLDALPNPQSQGVMRSLPPDAEAVARRIRERDRILDMLEAEEEEERQAKPSATRKKLAASKKPQRLEEPEPVWGDVVPGRLRDAEPPSLRAVHMNVVERQPDQPVVPAASRRIPRFRAAETDSDDEEPPSADLVEVAGAVQEDDGRLADAESDYDQGVDLDEAMLQREVTLEYYKRKGVLREAMSTASSLPAAPTTKHPGDWDQENVPLEANLANTKAYRSSVSKFKSERLAHTQVPANPLLAGAIKRGKLEGDELIAADNAISDDEEELSKLSEEGKRIIDQILRGETGTGPAALENEFTQAINRSELVNIGPPLSVGGLSVVPEPLRSGTALPRSPTTGTPSGLSTPAPEQASTPEKKKVSRFKLEQSNPLSQSSTPGDFNATTIAGSHLSSPRHGSIIGGKPPTISPSPISVPSPSSRAKQVRFKSEPGLSSTGTSHPSSVSAKSLQPHTQNWDARPETFPAQGFTSVILTPKEAARPVPDSSTLRSPSISTPPSEAPSTRTQPSRPSVMGLRVMESKDGARKDRMGDQPPRKDKPISRFKAERL